MGTFPVRSHVISTESSLTKGKEFLFRYDVCHLIVKDVMIFLRIMLHDLKVRPELFKYCFTKYCGYSGQYSCLRALRPWVGSQRGLLLWSLDVLLVHAWVLSGHSGYLPLSKNTCHWLRFTQMHLYDSTPVGCCRF